MKARRKTDDGLVPTAAAAELLGVSVSQFRALAAKLGIAADGSYVNPHYKSGPPALLWSRKTVARMKRTKAFAAAKIRKGGPTPRDYDAIFRKRYASPQDEAAIADAAEALFSLNRYTTHATCSESHRKEIFELKSAFVGALYRSGKYTDRVEKLTRVLPEQVCHGCDGLGCERCDDTGVWRVAREVATYVFRFSVPRGKRRESYTWLQPDRVLDFVPQVEETRPDDAQRSREYDQPINIPRAKLAEAKALLRFVLRAWP